jgi:hypothetical protein
MRAGFMNRATAACRAASLGDAETAEAVLGVSTAGTAFVLARDVPPFLLAGWRLQLVTLLLAPAAWREARLPGPPRRRLA